MRIPSEEELSEMKKQIPSSVRGMISAKLQNLACVHKIPKQIRLIQREFDLSLETASHVVMAFHLYAL